MSSDVELEAANRRIAGDLLVALIESGRLKPGGASTSDAKVISDTVSAFQALLAGINTANFDE